MTTFTQFVDSTTLMLDGYSQATLQQTHLTVAIATTTETTATVADAAVIPAPCMVEIDSELLWVESVDTGTDVITFAPFGRGYRGTTAATHAQYARVIVAPVVPRVVIEQAINDTILSTYPSLFGVGTTDITAARVVDTYELPAAAERLLSVEYSTDGPTLEWLPSRRWGFNPWASTDAFASGKSITVYDAVSPGQTIRVVYASVPTALTSGAALFTASGLRDAAQDLVRFGAASRLAPWFEVANVPGVAAEANYAAAMGRQNPAASAAKYLTQMYQLRLAEESAALHSLHPQRSHYTR